VFRPHSINGFILVVINKHQFFPLHGIKWLVILMQAELSSAGMELNSQLI